VNKKNEVWLIWKAIFFFHHRWEDNIKIDLQEVGCEGMNWIKLAQDRDR